MVAYLLIASLIVSTLHAKSTDISAYLRKQLKPSTFGLMRYQSPEALKQLVALPLEQISIDNHEAIEGSSVEIMFDQATDYDITIKAFTKLEANITRVFSDDEQTRTTVDRLARIERRLRRIELKEQEEITGFTEGAAIAPTATDALDELNKKVAAYFDEKRNALLDGERKSAVERARSSEREAMVAKEETEIMTIQEKKVAKTLTTEQAKEQIATIRTTYEKQLKELEAKIFPLSPEDEKTIQTNLADALTKIEDERTARLAGIKQGLPLFGKTQAEQSTALQVLRKPYRDKCEQIKKETGPVEEKDKSPRDLPMTIDLPNLLAIKKATLTTSDAPKAPPVSAATAFDSMFTMEDQAPTATPEVPPSAPTAPIPPVTAAPSIPTPPVEPSKTPQLPPLPTQTPAATPAATPKPIASAAAPAAPAA